MDWMEQGLDGARIMGIKELYWVNNYIFTIIILTSN
jgi:hypothetical protein